MRAHPRAGPELAREMIWAGSCDSRERDERKVRFEVSLYELKNLSDSRTWIRSPDGLRLTSKLTAGGRDRGALICVMVIFPS